MPELPEVETTVQGLRKTVVGLSILDVWTDLNTKDKRKNETIANKKYVAQFRKETVGQKIISVERRAKNILINLSGSKTILVHMKMTGHLLYGKYEYHPTLVKGRVGEGFWSAAEKGPLQDPFNKFLHVVFTLSNGKHLALSDMRKFAKVTLLDAKATHDSKHLGHLGPEPLEKSFTLEKLKERLMKRPNGKIKTVLMDQTIIAGIGNIYSDEILWRSGIHPERRIKDIQESKFKLVFKSVRETLSKGLDFGGDSTSDYRNIHGLPGKFQLHHNAYRKTGKPCAKPRCKGIIQRKIIAGRSAHFCNVHQK